ncbi:MAG: tryptophan--tRNA ligase [Oscillospiraceae bacterium]|nr:tryptophan--tRNA ligase [Oscillospiraceae bacterium]
MSKKIIFSGIQPTNTPHLGNYLGALKNWVNMQDEYDCIYSVVDLHAITLRQEPAKLRAQTKETYAILMALGIDVEKTLLFVQSHNQHHAELAWTLSCYTQFGELSRMTQFKDKSAKNEENINAGLFTYPILQAADILLYQADLVPVGADQKQHLELSRDIAVRFNNAYSETFTLPEPYIPTSAAKVKSLTEPTKKMSKSDENPGASVGLLDSRDEVIRKFKRAVTDSDAEIVFDEGNVEKSGINNLLSIYSAVSGKSISDCEGEFAGKGYGDFKIAVGEAVADAFAPIQTEYERLIADKAYLEGCMKSAAEKSLRISGKTLRKVYKKIGFVQYQ